MMTSMLLNDDMTSVRKSMTGTLPSFSTPGFVKPKPVPAPKQEDSVVIISSSESTPTSPFGKLPIKRSSSDSTLSSEQSPSSKRIRKDTSANKENLSLSEIRSREKVKGKAKERERERSKSGNDSTASTTSSIKDEPWQRMELDKEPNPFSRLDRDYPQHAARPASPVKIVQQMNHSDLNSVCPPAIFRP